MNAVITDNAKVRAAQIDAATKIQAASMHAASENKMTVGGNVGDPLNPVTWSLRVPQSQAQSASDLIRAEQTRVDNARRGVAPPGAVVDTSQTTGPAGPSPATPLPVAKQDTPAPTTQAVPGLKTAPVAPKKAAYTELTAGPGAVDAQNKTMVTVEGWKNRADMGEVVQDIQGEMRGGKYTNYQLPDGRIVVKGKSGNLYPVPPK